MAGLLKKALTIRQKQERREAPQSSAEGLNAEERQEIEARIEELFTERRLLPEDLVSKRTLKSGALLPITVNILVLLALAAGMWFLVIPNWDTEAIVGAGEARFETTEGFIVERVRQQAEEELSAQERRVAEIRRQLEQLREQQTATPSTDDQAAARESELQQELNSLLTQLEEQRAQGEEAQDEATSAFEQRLNELQQRQEEQRFLLNQLGFSYETVERLLSTGDSAAAVEELNRADQFLADYSVDGGGGFGDTISILQQGNAALREALVLFEEASEVDPRDAEQLARIDSAATLVEDADALMASGNEQEAEELYRSALAELNATERAFEQVEDLEAQRRAEERSELQEQLERARNEAAAREAELRQELAEARSALEGAETAQERASLEARLSGLEEELQSSRERAALLESRIDQRDRSIATLRAEAEEQLATVRQTLEQQLGDGVGADRSALTDLLETKTLIREVLSSDVVRREHPDLYEEMERYLDALGERRVAEGRGQGLYGSVLALQELMEGVGIAPATRVSSSASNEELRAALAEELFSLVQGVLGKVR